MMMVNANIVKRGIAKTVRTNGLHPPKSQLLTYTETLFINMTLIMVDVFMGNFGPGVRFVGGEMGISASDLRDRYNGLFVKNKNKEVWPDSPATQQEITDLRGVVGDLVLWIEQHSTTKVGLKELSGDERREYNKLKQRESRIRRK